MFAQSTPAGYLRWSDTRKLTADDFVIKTKTPDNIPCFAQFTISFESIAFGFLTKNFNKKVHNYFMPGASWIDTTANTALSLRYQQTLFDISEIYTRQIRKALRENRKQFFKNGHVVNDLNNQYMSLFAKRRVDYDADTKFGTDEAKQQAWEVQIQKELAALQGYAYDK